MCKSGKIINVILNSNNKISGGANNDATFYVDWSAILKDRTSYRVHFTYVGMPNTFTSATKLAQVQANFTMNTYLNQTSNNGAPTTLTLGVLRSFYLNGTINYLFADDNNNAPCYIPNRPLNNTISIRILTNDATPALWLDNATTPVVPNNWMLTLSFQEIDEDD
jgi:hypothetical protein